MCHNFISRIFFLLSISSRFIKIIAKIPYTVTKLGTKLINCRYSVLNGIFTHSYTGCLKMILYKCLENTRTYLDEHHICLIVTQMETLESIFRLWFKF